MKPLLSLTHRNRRLILLVSTMLICCALIGAPAISSVGHGSPGFNAKVAKSAHPKRTRGTLPAIQKDNPKDIVQDGKEEGSDKEIVQELFTIPIDMKGLSKVTDGAPSAHLAATVTELQEVEPNGTAATAQPLGGTSVKVTGNVNPNADLDYYSFPASTGDRVYAATQTLFSASASTDSIIEIIDTNGTTILEGDEDDGSFGSLSSSIANFTIPANGTYFIRVKHSVTTTQLRPYYLWFQLRSGSPTPETEPNDTFPGQALPASGWVSGSTSAAADVDFFSLNLNAGDTIFMSLDLDPERNGDWNGQLGLAPIGGFILLVNDSGAGFAPYTAPDSEAFFMTVKDAGTYAVLVSVPTGATPGTYTMSASVLPAADRGINCTTYTSTDVPKAIPDGGSSVSSTITVPGNPRIEHLQVSIQLNHTFMQDLDAELISPTGNIVGLFSDIGNGATGGPTIMNLTLDDFAGVPFSFAVTEGMIHQPELNYRLEWFKGQPAGGTWTLRLRDDFAVDTGTLTGWSIRICEPPPPAPCAPGFVTTTVFSTDFAAGAAGFTHTGTQDEWELGLPATLATTTTNPVAGLSTCNSGVNCWKTDLDNTYNASSTQDLISPNINLAGLSGPIALNWAQWFQMDTATNDHAWVEVRQVGLPATAVRVWEWTGAVMTNAVGTPVANVGESAGWGLYRADISSFAGQNVEVRFHLDSGTGVTNFAGLAIDDVSVNACQAVPDVAITKSGPASVTCGSTVSYTLTATNVGTATATGVVVTDDLPDCLSNVTCSVSPPAAGTCMLGANNLFTVTIPTLAVNGTVTITLSGTAGTSCCGSLSNQASISAAGDPNPTNNMSAVVNTTVNCPDVAISKSGTTNVTCGGAVTYTLTATNGGTATATGVTVTDDLPDCLSNVMCSVSPPAAGTCMVGAGNVVTVNIPSLATTDTVTITLTATATQACCGTISNQASISAACDTNVGNNTSATVVTTVDCPFTCSISPMSATNPVNTSHTVTVTVMQCGAVAVGRPVSFSVTGRNTTGASGTTNAQGQFVFTYTDTGSAVSSGSDTITACVEALAPGKPGGVPNGGSCLTTCTATKTWTVPCTLTCPSNITQGNDPNQCGAVVTYSPTGGAGCGTITCAPASGSFFPVGTTTVMCTATAGPTCSFSVTVVDNQAPAITCPANVSKANDPNQCGAVVTYPNATASDNCPSVGTPVCTPASGSFFPVGTTTVTCRVSDASTCANIFAVDTANNLVNFRTSVPGSISSKPITGMLPGEQALAIDFRPATGQLFALGSTNRIYILNKATGAATVVSAGPFATPLPGTDFGFDFNPTVDLIRAVGGTFDQNWRISPNNGAPVSIDTALAYASGDSHFGANPNVVGSAYTNNFVGATVTTLFGIDSDLDILLMQGSVGGSPVSPNTGQLFTIGPLGVSTTGLVGFDISQCGGTAYAVMQGSFSQSGIKGQIGGSGLYTINLANGASTLVGSVGGSNAMRAMSVETSRTSSCAFTVTVTDDQAPIITCPANITAVTPQNMCPPGQPPCQTITFPPPTASDNCPGVTVVCSPPSGACFPIGTATVTCTATDASNKTATCSFTVKLFDVCLQDDGNANTVLLFNSITGDYIFCCQGVTYTGQGKVSRQGCIFTLEHNTLDRRVRGTSDKGVFRGNASIQSPPGKLKCNIADGNIRDNSCMCH